MISKIKYYIKPRNYKRLFFKIIKKPICRIAILRTGIINDFPSIWADCPKTRA